MASEVIMPKLGMAMSEGVLVKWLKAEGEPVQEGEAIAEIETDKALVEIDAPATGILRGIRVQPGETVPVGTVLAYILEDGEALPSRRRTKPRMGGEGNPRR
jgi:Pyruvate/2-oxoglutarate dehydrogenase complex, dihydrolipoamide acyltransferase (E2) component, and related enzymes